MPEHHRAGAQVVVDELVPGDVPEVPSFGSFDIGRPEAGCMKLVPQNVALLFFNEAPHHFFPATQIDVVWFPDGPGGGRSEEKERYVSPRRN